MRMYVVLLFYSDLYERDSLSVYNLALMLGPPSSTTELMSVPAAK